MKYEINEKTKRLRYIRSLEKFNTKSISLLRYDNFDIELFKKAILRGFEELKKTPSLPLYSEYPLKLQFLSQLIIDSIENHSKDFKSERKNILKESNLLDKLKNNNRYKKDKHKNKKFNDGY